MDTPSTPPRFRTPSNRRSSISTTAPTRASGIASWRSKPSSSIPKPHQDRSMRAVFSRIGSRISCDANAITGALICAALIGRRVFVFALIMLAAVKLATRALHRDAVPVAMPRKEEAPPEPFVRRTPDALFHPPREYDCPAIPDVSSLRDALSRVVVGQRGVIEALMLSLIADGHVLFEGAPGL